jgi:hypothetical protein
LLEKTNRAHLNLLTMNPKTIPLGLLVVSALFIATCNDSHSDAKKSITPDEVLINKTQKNKQPVDLTRAAGEETGFAGEVRR